MNIKTGFFFCLILFGLSAFQCPRKLEKMKLAKIDFDYSTIDEKGLDRGEVSLDYEFCIPADEPHLNEVLAIEPDAKVMKSSKGRVGCTNQQWLCIVSTHHPQWRERLYAIASLSYVDRIIQTFYE